jgi:hypothetical protein
MTFFKTREGGDRVMVLKHKSDALTAQPCEFGVGKFARILFFYPNAS